MRGQLVSSLIGAAVGALGVVVFTSDSGSPDATPRADRSTPDLELVRQVEDHTRRIQELQKELAATKSELDAEREKPKQPVEPPTEIEIEQAPEAVAPLTEEEFEAGMKKFAGRLQSLFLGTDDGEAAKELRALLARAGPEGIAKVKKRFLDSTSGFEGRIVAAHVLGQSGDPEAIALLKEKLDDPDADLLEHRVASHALAFSPAEDVVPLLTRVARTDPDSGARANSAFGLVRRDIDEGYELYAEATDLAFERGQPEAIQFLQGYFLMGNKALPLVRSRLTTYENETALLVLIELVKQKKDKGALEQLRKLAYDSARPKSVQNAAQGAIKVLGGE